jgi:hypothetical protein
LGVEKVDKLAFIRANLGMFNSKSVDSNSVEDMNDLDSVEDVMEVIESVFDMLDSE